MTAFENDAKRKWDGAANSFDFLSYGDDKRLAGYKRRLFSKMHGESLMVATGTGNDFKFFPPGQDIVALDISPKMLEKAAPRAVGYPGSPVAQKDDGVK